MRRNIFIYGLSGSGKDTISNYLRDNYGYLKLRIAGTIKQYVFETYGFQTQDEFEAEKRKNPEVRLAHNVFGKQYDQEGLDRSDREATTNRIVSLCNRTALEFEICNQMQTEPICIVDVRNLFEAQLLLERGFYGIFLSRTSEEFADKNHKTEQNMFKNGELTKIFNNLKSDNDICIVFNDTNNLRLDVFEHIQKNIVKQCPENIKPLTCFTRGDVDVLLILVKNIILNEFDSKNIHEMGNKEIEKFFIDKFKHQK